MSSDIKTLPTSLGVSEFLASFVDDPQKHLDSLKLIELMESVSGCKATMWGPSIIGFDNYHYVYESGHQGDMCVIGFSPRKNNLVLYLLEDLASEESDRLERLGEYKASKACLYLKRLDDVDLDVLAELIEASYKKTKQRWP